MVPLPGLFRSIRYDKKWSLPVAGRSSIRSVLRVTITDPDGQETGLPVLFGRTKQPKSGQENGYPFAKNYRAGPVLS